jgi:hypothetical protein
MDVATLRREQIVGGRPMLVLIPVTVPPEGRPCSSRSRQHQGSSRLSHRRMNGYETYVPPSTLERTPRGADD